MGILPKELPRLILTVWLQVKTLTMPPTDATIRASKSCRRADACLRTFFEDLRKTGTFIRFWHNLTKLLKVSQVLWHFKPIVLRKIFSQKILPAQKN